MKESMAQFFMCGDKVKYATEKTAYNAIRHIKRTGIMVTPNFLPYKCAFCFKWHLGHRKQR